MRITDRTSRQIGAPMVTTLSAVSAVGEPPGTLADLAGLFSALALTLAAAARLAYLSLFPLRYRRRWGSQCSDVNARLQR